MDASTPPSLLSSLVSGAFAGIGFWCVALPFDTVRTLVQSSKSSEWVMRVKADPVLLLRGWEVAMCRGIPGAASTVVTFDYVAEYLDEHTRD